jgi:allantoinase
MKRADLIVRGGRLVLEDEVRRADLVVHGGKIAAIVDPGDRSYSADDEIDVRGKHVLPGLVDAHVHFNDPGHAEREGYVTGTRAAAAGGVTTVIDMPLSCTPATTSLAALDLKRAVAAEAAIVDYGHWGGLVTDNVEAMAALHEAGVLGFKAFMAETGVTDFPRATDGVLLAGLHEAARLGTVVLVHAENEEIAQYYTARLLAQGRRDPLAWAEGRPPVVEIEGIHCALFLAHEAGARLHIVHVSTPQGLDAVAEARARGEAVTAETCPQYLALCDEDLARIGVEAKCGPPLRARATMEELWERVLAGRVDSIASDHSPSVTEDKTRHADDVWAAWGGVPGLQTMLPVLLTEGVRRRGMPLPLLARLTATNPARQFGLYPHKGSLQPGADADLAIVDLEGTWHVRTADLVQRNQHSPFTGFTLHGTVERTLVRGVTVYDRGTFPAAPGHGRLLRRQGLTSHPPTPSPSRGEGA